MDHRYFRPTAARMQSFTIFLCGLSLSVFAGCTFFSSKPLPPPVTVPQILEMSKMGVPPGAIVQKMRDSGTVYRLQASQLAQLKAQGVPDAVLNYMQQTYLDAVRTDQSRADFDNWALLGDGDMYGGPWW
jgi:hypothetical protein